MRQLRSKLQSPYLHQLKADMNKVQEALGRIENRQLQTLESQDIKDYEFRVFSQSGEDGIIQHILRNITVPNKIFVEFGTESYLESNTRFLLVNNNWAGLIIDSSESHINYIKNDLIYWQYNLKAVHSFITKSNINQIFLEHGLQGDIGLLSIDIDGNDYWIWESINVINPAIAVIEYNSRFGMDKSVTIPYSDGFTRIKAHYSNIYFGASIRALCRLAHKKGYVFVGCNSGGSNAFFVRKDLKSDALKELTIEEGYRQGKFRESRDRHGNLTYLSAAAEQEILNFLPLIEINEA